MNPLPVDKVLQGLTAALAIGPNAVLIAPPGAGKTTRVPPALLAEPWAAGGRVLVLQPRRVAARAAAERMADEAGERVGRTFGYRTRLDSAVSAETRVEVMTAGVFVARIARDPELADVAAVLFDEAHERALGSDLGVALALDAQAGLRPDLRLLAMSATLDGARIAALMGDAPIIESAGRTFPVTLQHIRRDRGTRIEDAVARAVERALADHDGSVLAFLPGAGEIERVAERLRLPPGVALHRLHGQLGGSEQRAAIAPAPRGTRKLVLATSIAETSITIDGVSVVVDSGLARRPRYDRATGLTRLSTERVSQAAAAQRAGRAGRTAPGTAIRLWEPGEGAGFPPFDPPEILEADLSGLVLTLADWGADAGALRWRDPPPAGALAEARGRLAALGALGEGGRPTPHGRRIAALPLAPPLAHMLVHGSDAGVADAAAALALLLGEQGLGGRATDLDERRAAWTRDRSPRADAARVAARRLARGTDAARSGANPVLSADAPDLTARLIATAFPDRVARARGEPGQYLMANGRAARIDPADPLARARWLAVAEAGGAAEGARIMTAAAFDPATVEAMFADRIRTREEVRFDPATGGIVAETVARLGAIRLRRTPLANPAPARIADAFAAAVRAQGISLLPWGDAAKALRARVTWARDRDAALPDLSDAALLATLEDWLPLALGTARRLDAIDPAQLADALGSRIDHTARRSLDRIAPARFDTPAGTSHAIDYAAPAGPAVEVRVQELFGLNAHPHAGGTPLTLVLLSPARRPIQTTADLPGFWSGSWADVRRELRGRYPRHPWPEDPRAALPTTRAKPRGT